MRYCVSFFNYMNFALEQKDPNFNLDRNLGGDGDGGTNTSDLLNLEQTIQTVLEH